MRHTKLSILLVFLTFTVVNTTVAQVKGDSLHLSKPSFVAISVGVGIPHGNYALYDITNTAAGFAKPGLNLEISFAKVFWRRMGIALMYRHQSNQIDEADLLSQTTAKYPNITWGITTTPWKINAFMFGYYGSYPLDNTNKVFLDLKFMIGAVKVASPELDLTGSNSGATASVDQPASTAVSFAYCAGFGFKFNVDKDVCILLNADYLQANPEYANVPVTSSGGGSTNQTFTQNISTINISAGIAIKID